jgi:hypothetical protein
MGVGDPDESLLWLIPPFWGIVVGLPATYIVHTLLLMFDPEETVEAWFEKKFGFPENILAAYGTERMHKDHQGVIVARLLEPIAEPMTTPAAWVSAASSEASVDKCCRSIHCLTCYDSDLL